MKKKLKLKELVKIHPYWKKRIAFLIFDLISIVCLLYLAFALRFDFHIPPKYLSVMMLTLPFAVISFVPFYEFFNLYNVTWSFVSLHDLWNILKAVIAGGMFFFAITQFVILEFRELSFPRSVFLIYLALMLLATSGIRIAKRLYLHVLGNNIPAKKYAGDAKKLLIVGAGNAGEQILRNILKDKINYKPVGFIDDNPGKHGTYIHGVKVFGGRDKIPKIVREKGIDAVLIAIPTAASKDIKEIVALARDAGIKDIKILPSIAELINGNVTIRDIRDVSLEDLLGRAQVQIDLSEVESFLSGRKVLVTGSSGSIGEELCKQIAKFRPKELILFEIDETRLFETHEKLAHMFPNIPLIPVVGDIRDKNKVFYTFRKYRPEVVFHAAAYKHVPMMELHPDEAVKTNIYGTYNVGLAALESKAQKFIFISTDKAVNPTSVMGATKRIGEMLTLEFNKKNSTKFIAVRFGNVLGSRGSVIPIFEKQIAHGGPVTVTHPEMRRYFMTIPEAVLLVLQASAMGNGGEVYVLDMGEPVKILDLAKELIRLMGYEPDKDIPIVFTGVRPGEKLYEEILTAEEGTDATRHSQIFIARMGNHLQGYKFFAKLEALFELAENKDFEGIIYMLKELVPSYQPSKAKKLTGSKGLGTTENESQNIARLSAHP